eukprot:564192-Amphidinium_carterae.1
MEYGFMHHAWNCFHVPPCCSAGIVCCTVITHFEQRVSRLRIGNIRYKRVDCGTGSRGTSLEPTVACSKRVWSN